MEIIPIEYCDLSNSYVHLHQSQAACAFEHNCGESEFNNCPLKPFFSVKNTTPKLSPTNDEPDDMPDFYLRDEFTG